MERAIITLNPPETYEQITVVNAMNRADVWVFAVPNGGKRNKLEAVKLKREGVRAGAPDLVVIDFAPMNNRPTFIEMKRRKGGSYSPEQIAIHARARAQGWNVITPGPGQSAAWVLGQLRALGYPV